MLKRRIIIAIWLLGLAVLLGLVWQWYRFLTSPIITKPHGFYYILRPTASIIDLTKALSAGAGLVHPRYFILLAKLRGDTTRLKPGEYLFPSGITPTQLLDQLVAGGVITHRFTIIEGWTFAQISHALAAARMLRHSPVGLDDQTILQYLGVPYSNPEGLFYPATYHYTMGVSDLSLLSQAYRRMQSHLLAAWQTRAGGLPYTSPYQALIVASLIEKETAQSHEKPHMVGVILNRLKKNMYLQVDPTVIYGLGPLYDGRLKLRQLHIDSPYNTYLHKGLPPTPIAIPGESSLKATLHPLPNADLYYVATGTGGHTFSSTFVEHRQAIQRYRSWLSLQHARRVALDTPGLSTVKRLDHQPCDDVRCCANTNVLSPKAFLCSLGLLSTICYR